MDGREASGKESRGEDALCCAVTQCSDFASASASASASARSPGLGVTRKGEAYLAHVAERRCSGRVSADCSRETRSVRRKEKEVRL